MNLKILIAQQKGSYQNMFKTSLVNHRHSFQHSFLMKKLPELIGLCFGFFQGNKWGAKPLLLENPAVQGELHTEQMVDHCCNNLVRVTAIYLSFLETTLHLVQVSEASQPRVPGSFQWPKDGVSKLLPERSWWIRSAKLGSSPHQNIQSSLRPGLWSRRQTLSTSALRQRLKLLRMGSSSVTGNRMGADVGPCHT